MLKILTQNLLFTIKSCKVLCRLFIILVVFVLPQYLNANNLNQSKNGVLNLKEYNFEEDGNIRLNGEWKFYNEKFLTPLQVKNDRSYGYVMVPKNLSGQVYKGKKIKEKGFGTYYLQVIVNEKYHNHIFLLDTKRISTASKVYVNDELVGYNGEVSSIEAESQPSLMMNFNEFKCTSDTLNIVIHVSNYHTQKFGLFYNFELGLTKEMHIAKTKRVAVKLFVIGGILMLMLNFLILYFLRRKDSSSLYFAIMAFFAFVYVLRLSGVYFALVSSLGYEINYKVQMVGAYFLLGMLLVYISKIFPLDFSKKVLKPILIVNFLFVAGTIIFPVKINAHFLTYFNYFAIISMMYALYAVIKAVVKKRDGAVIFISGILLLFLTVVNDVLDEAQIINSPALLPVGLFMFLFTQVIYLSVRYSRTFAYTEKLSADLAIINKNLENIVDDRTKEIKNKNQELIELSGFKHDMINMLAHDLKNSLHIIINLAANKKVKYAGYVMHNLIMNFLDINKSEETHLQLTKSQSSLKRMVTNAILQTKLFAEQKSVVITNKVLQDIQILVDKELMLRVFVNLITNAIKYSPVGNEVLIESCIVKIDNTQSVEISIIDYGEGISDDKKDKVFDKYFSDGKKSGTIRSTGLGLAFCKMAIEAHNSSILVDSHKGKFTKFYFVLPVLSVKNDNDDQSVQNINSSQIRFDAAELEYLKPISKQLFLCKIYQASELRRILNAITDSEFENIRLWKHHLEKAIYNYNSNDFEFLLNTLKQQLDYA